MTFPLNQPSLGCCCCFFFLINGVSFLQVTQTSSKAWSCLCLFPFLTSLYLVIKPCWFLLSSLSHHYHHHIPFFPVLHLYKALKHLTLKLLQWPPIWSLPAALLSAILHQSTLPSTSAQKPSMTPDWLLNRVPIPKSMIQGLSSKPHF